MEWALEEPEFVVVARIATVADEAGSSVPAGTSLFGAGLPRISVAVFVRLRFGVSAVRMTADGSAGLGEAGGV